MPRCWQSVPLVAAGLGVPEQTIRTWIRRGQVEVLLGQDGTIHVNVSEVLARRAAPAGAAA